MKLLTTIILCGLLAMPAQAANWYVRPTAAGSANGSNWNNAWSIANLNSNWGSVAPGDTVWLAGGLYATTYMNPTASGTAANRILVTRPLASDAIPTSAAGWSSAFDTPVVQSNIAVRTGIYWNTAGVGNYLNFDGRTPGGWKIFVPNTADGSYPAGIHFWGSANASNVNFRNFDIQGAFDTGIEVDSGINQYFAALTIYPTTSTSFMQDITFTNVWLHGTVNLVNILGNSAKAAMRITFDTCKFYNNTASSPEFHGNMIECRDFGYLTFNNCEFHTWLVEGIMPYGASYGPIYITGNVFRDTASPIVNPAVARCFEPHSLWEIHIYNNTFVNIGGSGVYSAAAADKYGGGWAAGSKARNNIYYNSAMGSPATTHPDPDYEWTTSASIVGSGTHNIVNGTNPFIDLANRDLRIVETVSSALPRNKGFTIADEPFASYLATDRNGVTRGGDGTWDIGAFEFDDGSSPIPPTIIDHPESQSIPSGSTASMSVSANGSAPMTYQWYQGVSGSTASPIGGATSSSYTTPALTSTTQYWVRVTNAAGSDDSATATITVTAGGGGTSGGDGGAVSGSAVNAGTIRIGTVRAP